MRCGLALSLIYQPRVLLLDEPTLGLDVSAVQLMRQFISTYSQQAGATVLLTSHYMADVESLCKRIVLIDEGTVKYDGTLAKLTATLATYKLIHVSIADQMPPAWDAYGSVIEAEPNQAFLRVHRDMVAPVTARLLAELTVTDLAVENPPLERVIDQIYSEGLA